MHEILARLRAGDRVLDLGSGSGSFSLPTACVIRVDLETPEPSAAGHFVQADAARLPFRKGAFAAVVSNHSLEHVAELDEALKELGRVVRPDGFLFVAVPDAQTFTDRVYRWLSRGGGHVNPFVDPSELAATIETQTGLPSRGWRVLFSSFSFLNAQNFRAQPPRRVLLFGGGREGILRWWVHLLRRVDDAFGTRLAVYGWAFYFGDVAPEQPGGWRNVCIRCGSASPYELVAARVVPSRFRPGKFPCPACGALNFLVRDFPESVGR